MLVVHRTGSGKTGTMIQIANSYFLDRRPKIVIFPTSAVCASFYRELRHERFPNRYADYMRMLGDEQPARKSLELHGVLREGVVKDEYLQRPFLPSAPLRAPPAHPRPAAASRACRRTPPSRAGAFSYTQAGGNTSCGQNINAVFKCPDGYAGQYPRKLDRAGGYPDYVNRHNPFSNKATPRPSVASPGF